MTVSNSQAVVVSVGTSGVYIAGSDSSSTYYPLPTTAATPPAPTGGAGVVGIVDGYTISAVPGESAVVIGGQTVTFGGSLITLADHDVVSLGPNGLVVQMPGGGVTTISVALASAVDATASSGKGVGGAIASSIFHVYLSFGFLC